MGKGKHSSNIKSNNSLQSFKKGINHITTSLKKNASGLSKSIIPPKVVDKLKDTAINDTNKLKDTAMNDTNKLKDTAINDSKNVDDKLNKDKDKLKNDGKQIDNALNNDKDKLKNDVNHDGKQIDNLVNKDKLKNDANDIKKYFTNRNDSKKNDNTASSNSESDSESTDNSSKTINQDDNSLEQSKILFQIKAITDKEIEPEMPLFEKKLQSLYVGCFSDDPSNPSMEKHLGHVSNTLKCIELGKRHNYKYVGIQQGNVCYGSNNIPKTQLSDRKTFCNVGCDDIETGNCGGFFYNQVYKTDINDTAIKSVDAIIGVKYDKNAYDMLEKFGNLGVDLEKINYKINNSYMDCIKPLNNYYIFFWIIIIIILIYLIFEYMNM